MEELRKRIESIKLDVFINCILVQNNVRPAFLIQPADYREATSTGPKTSAILTGIRRYFPELILSDIRGETLVSKRAYTNADIKTDTDMGTIIGYPCAKDYPYIREHNNTITTTTIDIVVHLLPGEQTDRIQLFAYVCLDDSQYAAAKKLAAACERVLKKDPVVGPIIGYVEAVKSVNNPVSLLIEKLVRGTKNFNEEETYDIENYIANLGFDNIDSFAFDYTNPVHRGMIIALLSLYKNNPLSPFFPLQHQKNGAESDRINAMLESELIQIFADTVTKGGKAAKRKTLRKRR
jgi:hypothetical protein